MPHVLQGVGCAVSSVYLPPPHTEHDPLAATEDLPMSHGKH